MLRRYWLIIDTDNRYGSRNIGVTAFSKEHAVFLAKEQFQKMKWTWVDSNLIEHAEIIEDIDIRLLEQKHVALNMGVVVFQGVWWPNFNKYP